MLEQEKRRERRRERKKDEGKYLHSRGRDLNERGKDEDELELADKTFDSRETVSMVKGQRRQGRALAHKALHPRDWAMNCLHGHKLSPCVRGQRRLGVLPAHKAPNPRGWPKLSPWA